MQKLNTTQKKKTTQNGKTKLAWFSHSLRHSTRKPGLILQRSRANIGREKFKESK